MMVKKRIRSLYINLYEYAKVLNNKPACDFSEYLNVASPEKSTKHLPFTKEEIIKLWENRNDFIDVILL